MDRERSVEVGAKTLEDFRRELDELDRTIDLVSSRKYPSNELDEERSHRLAALGNMREDLLKQIYYRESGVIF